MPVTHGIMAKMLAFPIKPKLVLLLIVVIALATWGTSTGIKQLSTQQEPTPEQLLLELREQNNELFEALKREGIVARIEAGEQIHEINLDGQYLTSLDGLSRLPGVTALRVNACQYLQDYSELAVLTDLHILAVSLAPLPDSADIGNAPQLECIVLWDTSLNELEYFVPLATRKLELKILKPWEAFFYSTSLADRIGQPDAIKPKVLELINNSGGQIDFGKYGRGC